MPTVIFWIGHISSSADRLFSLESRILESPARSIFARAIWLDACELRQSFARSDPPSRHGAVIHPGGVTRASQLQISEHCYVWRTATERADAQHEPELVRANTLFVFRKHHGDLCTRWPPSTERWVISANGFRSAAMIFCTRSYPR